MSEALEMLKKAVEILEREEKEEGRVELGTLPVGSRFSTEIGKFIVLEQDGKETKVITEGLYMEDKEFGSNTDYKESKIRELCDGEILEAFEKVFGANNIVEHEVDLTTLDCQKVFGSMHCKVRPLTFDEARKFNELLVNNELPDLCWTCTAWSTEERGWKYSIAVVSPAGNVRINYCGNDDGVRPVCILKSNILVSKED